MDFTVGGLVGALVANIFAAFKGNESKKLMDSDKSLKERIGGTGNQFAIMTIIALLTSIPLMLFKEGPRLEEFVGMYKKNPILSTNVILSGLTFYAYNELATMTLTKISAVTQSVANTAKRVVGMYLHCICA
jgi:solute carrier family 35 protein E1